VDGADEDAWSAVAEGWAELWGPLADPVRRTILAAAGVGPGARVLDVGCGSGELLAHVEALGAHASGADPAPGMVALARALVPGADVRVAPADALPWEDARFDVVTAVNSLQLAASTTDALAEAVRVTVPGGRVALASWAEGPLNDLDVVERAVAAAAGDDVPPDGPLREAGGFEALLAGSGLTVLAAGLVEVPWEVRDDATLVRGVLLGEDAEGTEAGHRTVVDAARPFRTEGGGYRLVNAFRYAVGVTPA
jgi:SAM-dependent methyltransferase